MKNCAAVENSSAGENVAAAQKTTRVEISTRVENVPLVRIPLERNMQLELQHSPLAP